jgi:hypothetical protein
MHSFVSDRIQEVAMNIIQTFFVQILKVDEADLTSEIAKRLATSPFSDTTLLGLDLLFEANPCIVDDLWKYSVCLDIPHQLLFESFQLQSSINRWTAQ